MSTRVKKAYSGSTRRFAQVLRIESLETRALLSVAPVATDDQFEAFEDSALVVDLSSGVLSNDTDADGDALTAVLVEGPKRGQLSLSADGSFAYTPEPDFWGVDTFRYRASDSVFQSELAFVTIIVNNTNDPPSGSADSFRVDVNGTLLATAQSGVLINDRDIDPDALSAILATGPSHGELTLSADGGFEYTPTAGFHGIDTFSYLVSDGTIASAPTAVQMVVNTLPVVAADSYSVSEDESLFVPAPGLLANDSDVDGDSLTVELVARPTHGAVVVRSDGSVIYSPHPEYHGVDEFTYRVRDGFSATSPQRVTLNVVSVADPPQAVQDHYVTVRDQTIAARWEAPSAATPLVRSLDVRANDLVYDSYRQRIYASLPAVSSPGNQIAVIDPITARVEKYLPAGVEPTRLALSDGGEFLYVGLNGDRALARINLNTGLVDLQVSLNGLVAEDLDAVPGQPRSVAVALRNPGIIPGHEGVAIYDDDVQRPLVTPGHTGSNTIAFGDNPERLWGYNNETTEYGFRTMTVHEGGVAVLSVQRNLLNGSGVEIEAAGNRVYSTTGRIIDPLLGQSIGVIGGGGPFEVDLANNRITYLVGDGANRSLRIYSLVNGAQVGNVPLPDAAGAVGSVIRFDRSGIAFRSASGKVYLIESPDVSSQTVYGVLANDVLAEAPDATAVISLPPANGSLSLQQDGRFTFTPDAGFVGSVSFEYAIQATGFDDVIGRVSIEVLEPDAPPVAADDSFEVAEDGELLVGSLGVLANDHDGRGRPLTAELLSTPEHGELVFLADGTFEYRPDENYFGPDSFSYRANNGGMLSTVAHVQINVASVNDRPIAIDDEYQLNQSSSLHAILDDPSSTAGDVKVLEQATNHLVSDPTRQLLYASTPGNSSNGNRVIGIDPRSGAIVKSLLVGSEPHRLAISDDGQYLYVSLRGADRVRRILLSSFQLDSSYDVTAQNVVDIDVMPGRPGTIAVAQHAGCCGSGEEGVALFDHNVRRVGAPFLQKTDAIEFDDTGDRIYSTDGYHTRFTVHLVTAHGVILEQQLTDFFGGEFWLDNGLIYTTSGMVAEPLTQSRLGVYPTGFNGASLVVNSPSSQVYFLDYYSGRIRAFDQDTFLQLDEAESGSPRGYSWHLVQWQENGFAYRTDQGQVRMVRTNFGPMVTTHRPTFNDLDVEGDSVTAELLTPPAHGALQFELDGTFVYTPVATYSGADEFTYRVYDGQDYSRIATVRLDVLARDLKPIATNDAFEAVEDTTLSVLAPGVLANDADGNAQPLTARLLLPPSNGRVELNADGSFVYTPRREWSGLDEFWYMASDGLRTSRLTPVRINVASVDDLPLANPDVYRTEQNQTLNVQFVDAAAAWPAVDLLIHDRTRIRRHDAPNGASRGTFAVLPNADDEMTTDMTFGPDGDLYTYTWGDEGVYRFDGRTGAAKGAFTTGYLLREAYSIEFAPNGNLIVADYANRRLVEFDGETGEYLGRFGFGTMFSGPVDMAFGPDGYLYVALSFNTEIMRFDAETGAFRDQFQPDGLYDQPRSLTFGLNGDLYVNLNVYDAEDRRLKQVIANPTSHPVSSSLVGDDGLLYVAFEALGVYRFDPDSGLPVDTLVPLSSQTTSIVIDPWSRPSLGVRANDIDAENGDLRVELVQAPRVGTLQLSQNGTFRYDAPANFEGEVQFTYRLRDGAAYSSSAAVTIIVGAGNTGFPGDTNADGVVDLADLNNVRNNFGATGAVLGDVDRNGIVDLADLNAVRNNFGATQNGVASTTSAAPPLPRPRSISANALDLIFHAMMDKSDELAGRRIKGPLAKRQIAH